GTCRPPPRDLGSAQEPGLEQQTTPARGEVRGPSAVQLRGVELNESGSTGRAHRIARTRRGALRPPEGTWLRTNGFREVDQRRGQGVDLVDRNARHPDPAGAPDRGGPDRRNGPRSGHRGTGAPARMLCDVTDAANSAAPGANRVAAFFDLDKT